MDQFDPSYAFLGWGSDTKIIKKYENDISIFEELMENQINAFTDKIFQKPQPDPLYELGPLL